MRTLYCFILAGFFMFSACNNSNKKQEAVQNNESEITEQSDAINSEIFEDTNTAYFSASGTEPFWNLEVSEKQIVFKTPIDSIKMSHVEPILAQDSNVKLYKIETESTKMTIQISQMDCTNAMSGKVSPYSVTIEYKKGIETEFQKLEGCGRYMTDYRLHDIWVLETLNGKTITKEDFPKEFPSMEIHAADNKFMGFAGCNRMNGKIFFEKDLLRFTKIATTKMLCEPNNKEAEFLKALQSSISYSIENNRLTLSSPSGILTVFKKVD
ncbi:META domain-containing protein [Xanthomarina sp. GH4-25]|uniref:META domain-containing protein n=1 Tax=Xanthomarina sp. GH4-25 TaxID=3349335 RepID=UPI0038779EAB